MKKFLLITILVISSIAGAKTCKLSLSERKFEPGGGSEDFVKLNTINFEADSFLKNAGIIQRNVIDITEKGLKVVFVVGQKSDKSTLSKVCKNEVTLSVFDLDSKYLISQSQQSYKTLSNKFQTLLVTPDVKNLGNQLLLEIKCN